MYCKCFPGFLNVLVVNTAPRVKDFFSAYSDGVCFDLHLVLVEGLGKADQSFKPLTGILLTTEKMSQHIQSFLHA